MAFLVNSSLFDLLLWVKEFVQRNVKSADLSDGVIIADILHSLSPNDFSASWKANIHDAASSDSSRKAANLDKIVGAISKYFAEVIDQPLSIAQLPDVTLIAEINDESELFRLLQLVLCCAVNCRNKETHIQAILSMEQSVQRSIMEAIQSIMSEIPSNKTKIASGNFSQRCQELEAKIVQLESEKSVLQSEADEMMRRLSSVDQNVSSDLSHTADDSHLSPIPGAEPGSIAIKLQIRQLQHKLACVRDELYHSEADNQETKLRMAETQAALEDLKVMNDALLEKAREAKQLKDDLDIARDEVLNARRLLASTEQWKKRAEEATALRVRCSKLEADNAACLEMVAKLEQENRLTSNLRSQAETNRQQSAEAQSRASELLTRAEKAENSLDKLRSELQTTIHEKQVVTNEFNRLREQYDKLSTVESDAVVGTSSLTAAFEKSANHRALNLSFDSRNIEAEQDNHGSVTTAHSISPMPSLTSVDRVAAVSHCVPTTTDADSSSPDFAKAIALKNEEIYQIEQRYRGYLAKTLEIIRCMDRRNSGAENRANSNDHSQIDSEIVRLQSLLVEKENIIEKLENHYENARRQRDLEERMVLTAWYHLGMRMKREEMMSRLQMQSEPLNTNASSSDTLANPHLIDESFLAGQRRVHLQSTPPQTRFGFSGP